jgi:hypothetical protein
MIHRLRLVLTHLLLLTASGYSIAQTDITHPIVLGGKWTGTSNWGKQVFTIKLDLKQEGNLLSGQIEAQTLEKTKSATYLVSGFINGSMVAIKATKFISKEGTWCLPAFNVKFLVDSNNKKLTGRWKNNNVKEGCWPGVTGRVELVKIGEPQAQPTTTASARGTTISSSDREGNALSAELQKRNYYALIIAVQDYPDKEIVDLDQPIGDALALKNALLDDYTFTPERVTFLQNPSRATIIETFDRLTASVEINDNLLIFYAGHGIWDSQIEQGYWLPSDAKKSSKAAWLSNGTIRDYIRAIDSKHTLLITDACFGGGILKTREAFQSSKAMLEMYKLPSRKAMTSGALKTVPDKSVFIEYLLKALKNNEQPLISADQLFTTFKYNVINNSPNGQVPQYGVISQADDEGGDFIFLKKN